MTKFNRLLPIFIFSFLAAGLLMPSLVSAQEVPPNEPVIDYDAPDTIITNPSDPNPTIEDYFIHITGSTTDNEGVGVASTTIEFASYIADEGDQLGYCEESYSPITILTNQNQTSPFDWSYDWIPTDGVYCIRAYSVDYNGNNEFNQREGSVSEIVNITFKKKIDPEPEPEPEPAPVPPPPSGHRSSNSSNTGAPAVLGASTSAEETLPPTEFGSVEIVWNTNVETSSQVVYGLTAGGPYRVNLAKANFGFPFATAKIETKVKNHSVSLPNLIIGASYSLRVVSAGEDLTFGPEYRFRLNPDGSVTEEGTFGSEIAVRGESGETVEDFIEANISLKGADLSASTTEIVILETQEEVSSSTVSSWSNFFKRIKLFFTK